MAAVKERYEKMREAMKPEDKEDKRLEHMRLREKRIKAKEKRKRNTKRGNTLEEEVEGEDVDGRATEGRTSKRSKIYFDSKSDDDSPDYKDDNDRGSHLANFISLAQQEELALKLLSSMHS